MDNITEEEMSRAKTMHQLEKGAWLQRAVEAGQIRSHSELLKVSVKIGAGSRVFAHVQDYFGTGLPATNENHQEGDDQFIRSLPI